MFNYNLFTMIDAYYKNHDLIVDYIRNRKRENFNENGAGAGANNVVAPQKSILGMAVGTFLFFLVLYIAVYLYTIWAFFKYYNKMSFIAIAAALFCFFSGAGLISLIIIYASKSE